MQNVFKEFQLFKGLKNDEDQKDLPLDYFFRSTNYNFPNIGLSGFEKITMPERINSLGTGNVDGEYEYRFLDQNNKLQVQHIGVCDGNIYKDILTTPVLLRSGLTTGKCDFSILNDKLYIANGKDYVFVYDGAKGLVSQMGAPIAEVGTIGILTGAYYWAMTYVNAGGEEVVGSVSNSLTLLNNRVTLNLPIGYTGTTSRKIYRTEAGGSTLKLVTTVADNTTLTYVDNITDVLLTTTIPAINNELPKPYFIRVFNEAIIGAKVDKYPTQIFITNTEIDVFDLANGLDIANFADDNSAVEGIGIDFANIVIGTNKHIYLIGIGTSTTVTTTRANIGIKDGYSVQRIPAYGNFSGGLMFVSTNNDVRVLVGLKALPVATSVDNIYSDNFSQNIRGSLSEALNSPDNIDSEYNDYRYNLVIDGNKYVYDIRTNGWTFHNIQTENYKSTPFVLSVLNGYLHNGQTDGYVEQEYRNIQYRDEDVPAVIESANIMVSGKYNFFQRFIFWFLPSEDNELEIEVISDDDKYFSKKETFNLRTGAYSETDFSSAEYEIADEMTYKIFNVYRPVRWIKFILTSTKGNIIFQRWGMFLQTMTGKE